MKFIPILFSSPMVQAILAGDKTMTRRVVKPQPSIKMGVGKWILNKMKQAIGGQEIIFDYMIKNSPYGNIGDVLWVRETWQKRSNQALEMGFDKFYYKASWQGCSDIGWKPSIHMPKTACRIFLQITDIRVERLQNITEEDAIAEGIIDYGDGTYKNYFTKKGLRPSDGVECLTPIASFQSLFCNINGITSWDKNPFVWVISFKQIPQPAEFLN